MSERTSHRSAVVFAVLLLGMLTVPAGAARHRGTTATSRRHATAWSRIELRHVSPQYVLDALQQGREWRALLHGAGSRRLLEGVALVIPSSRTGALLVRGTRDGVAQLRQIVGLLDTPRRAVQSPRAVGSVTQAYQMVLRGEWQRSVIATRAVLSRDPLNAEASALQAYSLVKLNKTNEAETPMTRALHQADGATGRARALALLAEGALAAARGNKAQAISDYQQAGNADESCALAYLAFAEYAHANGKDDTAKKLLQGALAAVRTPQERAAISARLGAL